MSQGLEENKGHTYKVPQPVRRSGQGNTLGTDGQRVDLANDDPRSRTPGRGKEEDVDADKDNQDNVGRVRAGRGSADNGDDELAHQHAEGAVDEQRATANLFNGPEGDGGRDDVDDVGDDGDEKRVFNTDLLEEGGAVVAAGCQ